MLQIDREIKKSNLIIVLLSGVSLDFFFMCSGPKKMKKKTVVGI